MGARDELIPDSLANRTIYWSPNGQPIDFSSWTRDNPSNTKGNEHCVHIWSNFEDYKWNDNECTMKYGFICEEPRLVKEADAKIITIQKNLKASVETLNNDTKDKIVQVVNNNSDNVLELIKEKTALIMELTENITDDNANMNCTKYLNKKSEEQNSLLVW